MGRSAVAASKAGAGSEERGAAEAKAADWECSASLEWRSPHVQPVYMESTSKVYGDGRDYDEEVVLMRRQDSCTNAYPHLHLKATQGYKELSTELHNMVIGREDEE